MRFNISNELFYYLVSKDIEIYDYMKMIGKLKKAEGLEVSKIKDSEEKVNKAFNYLYSRMELEKKYHKIIGK